MNVEVNNISENINKLQSNDKLNYSEIVAEVLKERNEILKTEISVKENILTEALINRQHGKKIHLNDQLINNYKYKSNLNEPINENKKIDNKSNKNINLSVNQNIENLIQNPKFDVLRSNNSPNESSVIKDVKYKPIIYNNIPRNLKNNLVNENSPSKLEYFIFNQEIKKLN
jgi:hypothetical protein